jgi:D-xylose transport system substrate-binding protein
MRNPLRSVFAAGLVLVAAALVAIGCGSSDDNSSSSSGGGGGGGTIALLLPENQTPRYEAADKPFFEKKVKELCADCKVLYSNAQGDINDQQSQAESALTQGADVLVVDAVDAASAAGIVTKAKAQDVPVVSYDRLILDSPVDYYISYDNEKVGELQGSSLAAKLKSDGNASGPIVKINGDPADNNAKLFSEGGTKALDAAGVKVAKESDTPGWLASNAQNEMQQAITALGNTGFNGVLAANDDTAGGAIAAMKSAGVDPKTRPTTGQDATAAGLQRILVGEQYMTVYKAATPEANASAEIAVALAQGKKVPSGLINDKTNNGQVDVPSVIFTPVALTLANIADKGPVVDGEIKASDVCTGQFAAACKKAGVS